MRGTRETGTREANERNTRGMKEDHERNERGTKEEKEAQGKQNVRHAEALVMFRANSLIWTHTIANSLI